MNNARSHFIQPVNLSKLMSMLIKTNFISQADLYAAIQKAQLQQKPVVHYLVKMNILRSDVIFNCCKKHFSFPIYNNNHQDWPKEILCSDLIYRYHTLPLLYNENTITIAMSDPTDQPVIDVIEFHTSLRVIPILIDELSLEKVLIQQFKLNPLTQELASALAKIPDNLITTTFSQPDDDEPVTLFVNKLIEDAMTNQISDIHIEPHEDYCRIRFRRDGHLFIAAQLPTHFAARIITRIKLIANLNIAEHRQPQDGRISKHLNDKIDVRVNTCPALHGEKIVLRLLNTHKHHKTIEELGLISSQLTLLKEALHQPHGLILVTGPTGSGKTVTLYAALQYLNNIEKNICTIEDPIEIALAGINQVNIIPKMGLDFAAILRSCLRQDPDILMVGEIRDLETAAITLQASQTGHLVLSTLHTNSAIESLYRLKSMGVASYQLISTLSLIVAQRLVRQLCPYCKEREVVKHQAPLKTIDTIYCAVGCDACHQGYKGRIGIFEILPMSNQLIQLFLHDTPAKTMQEALETEGFLSLQKAGLQKIRDGLVSPAELKTVLGYNPMSSIRF